MKLLRLAVAILVIAAAAYIVLARTGQLAPSEADVRATYAGPPSVFVTLDGVPIRYKDEGQGPVVVLLHAGLHSLEMWDGWAQQLKSQYRVIRLDLPPNGLSGLDSPEKNNGFRASDLLALLLDHLKVSEFALAGISSGSTVALRYTVKHPEQVKALLLSSVPIAPPAGGNSPAMIRSIIWLSANVFGGYRPHAYWREQLKMTFGDDDKITDAMVERQWALNEMPGRKKMTDAYAANNRGSGFDYAAELAGMKTPVLIQWGGASPVLPAEKANELAALFKSSTDVQTIIYPGAGHYLYLERPDESVRDAMAFLAKHQ